MTVARQQLCQSSKAYTMDKDLEHVLIAAGITEKSRKLSKRDFIDCDGLEGLLVSFTEADASDNFITDGVKEMPMTALFLLELIHGW